MNDFLNNITLFFQNINLQDVWNFIINPPNEGVLLIVKVVFIIISFILLGTIIPLFLVANWKKYRYIEDATEFVAYRPFGAKETLKQWAKISNKLESNKEAEYKLAVIEADSLFEEILEKNGYIGELMEDKLEKADAIILSDKEKILEAHKIRNNIVHNPDYKLSLDEAKKSIEIFEEALRNLEAF